MARQTPLPVLACPECRAGLELTVEREDDVGVADGSLRCIPCSKEYSIAEGIFRFDVTAARELGATGDEWIAEDFINLVPEGDLYYNHAQWLERHLGLSRRVAEQVARYESPHRIGGMLDALELGPGAVVADVGCGVGYLLFHVLERFGHLAPQLVGIDILPKHISHFRARQVEAVEKRVLPILGSGAKLPLADGALDAILCSEVVEHFADPPACFAELSRVLKPSGQLVITTPNAGPYDRYHGLRGKIQTAMGNPDQGEGFYDAPVTPEVLAGFLRDSGFTIERQRCNIKVPFARRFYQTLPGPIASLIVNTLETVLPARSFGMNQIAISRKE